jgi:5-methylcytosine-specific restriction endonuclease McrA
MSKDRIPAHLARKVRERARLACEYCRLSQSEQEATFHIDHIHPAVLGGSTRFDNLALACVSCSLSKAARSGVRDPATGKIVSLFHPRRDVWSEHFDWTAHWRVVGLTPTGRATVTALKMNRPAIVAIRRLLANLKRFPAAD